MGSPLVLRALLKRCHPAWATSVSTPASQPTTDGASPHAPATACMPVGLANFVSANSPSTLSVAVALSLCTFTKDSKCSWMTLSPATGLCVLTSALRASLQHRPNRARPSTLRTCYHSFRTSDVPNNGDAQTPFVSRDMRRIRMLRLPRRSLDRP
eukprot:50793-Chlamydomonas_euryale.AAC.2